MKFCVHCRTGSLEIVEQDSELDATEYAQPAWWRGHEYTKVAFCREVNKILDGAEIGDGLSCDIWHALKERLKKLRRFEQDARDAALSRKLNADCNEKPET